MSRDRQQLAFEVTNGRGGASGSLAKDIRGAGEGSIYPQWKYSKIQIMLHIEKNDVWNGVGESLLQLTYCPFPPRLQQIVVRQNDGNAKGDVGAYNEDSVHAKEFNGMMALQHVAR